jgi:NADPH2:quinone reductase
MRAVRFERTGGPEVLELRDVEAPEPGPGQILIRHQAIGVNFIDTYHRTGFYPVPTLPSAIGQEAAGVVAAIGDGVTRFKVGERAAYAMGSLGAYAEFKTVSAGRAVRIPDAVDTRTAAAVLLKGMTAEFLLNRAHRVEAGQAVLIHAAAGGVGQLLTQWAKALGAVVIAAVGSPAKAERVRQLGVDHVILYDRQDVAAEVRRITGGEGVPVAYDSVGRDTFEGTLGGLARRGLFVSYGASSGPPPPIEAQRLARAGSLYFTRPGLVDYVVTTEELDASAAAVFGMVSGGKLAVEIGQTFPLAEARQAHEALEARRTIGASLLLP